MDIVACRGVIVGEPEMGRTFGDANRKNVPLEHNGRVMQKIQGSRLTQIAHESGARILPGWIEVPYYRGSPGLWKELRLLLRDRKHGPIIYNFRRPTYRTEEPFDLARENARLQDEIFNA